MLAKTCKALCNVYSVVVWSNLWVKLIGKNPYASRSKALKQAEFSKNNIEKDGMVLPSNTTTKEPKALFSSTLSQSTKHRNKTLVLIQLILPEMNGSDRVKRCLRVLGRWLWRGRLRSASDGDPTQQCEKHLSSDEAAPFPIFSSSESVELISQQ